ncbi:MAG: AAA family ATPase, partial [Longispora sp.]|nr:AAA family ATPase [Longispora sp. (in: high G+C Gram-positive bacteria)]
MRPLRLDVAGFTVFREHAVLDLTDADLFALVGPTGSGKSSLLDAMCFALYGTVPRWGKRGGVAGVLAPSSAEARVRLVFEASGQRYAASRVVRRVG